MLAHLSLTFFPRTPLQVHLNSSVSNHFEKFASHKYKTANNKKGKWLIYVDRPNEISGKFHAVRGWTAIGSQSEIDYTHHQYFIVAYFPLRVPPMSCLALNLSWLGVK